MDWSPILSKENKVEKILVAIRDVTKFRQVLGEANENAKKVKKICELLEVTDNNLSIFIHDSLGHLDKIKRTLKEGSLDENSTREIFVHLHTFKGMTRIFGLSFLSLAIHSAEEALKHIQAKTAETPDSDSDLEEKINEATSELEDYIQIARDFLKKTDHGGDSHHRPLKFAIEENHYLDLVQKVNSLKSEFKNTPLLNELRTNFCRLLGESIEEIMHVLVQSSQVMAKDLGKPIFQVQSIGFSDVFIKKTDIGWLSGTFSHLIQNSIGHGFETLEDRERNGKVSDATITIRFVEYDSHGNMVMEYFDNGKGLNLKKLKSIAEERKLLHPDDQPDEDKLMNLIFIAGFSTADKITEISGRGVGMDALSQNLSDQGGNISIASNGRGSDGFMPIKFRITLPHQCLL